MFTYKYQDLTHLYTFNVDTINSKDVVDAPKQINPSTTFDTNAFYHLLHYIY